MSSETRLRPPHLAMSCGGDFFGEDNICFLTDPQLFEDIGVRLGFTMRHGGVSQKPYDSLNLGSNVGDDPICVEHNRRLALDAMGLGEYKSNYVCPVQVHGQKVIAFVDDEDKSLHANICLDEVDSKNSLRIQRVLESPMKATLVSADGSEIVELFKASSTKDRSKVSLECDAIISRISGLPVMLCFADCVPVIIVSPTRDYAVVHSGWRGTYQSIAGKAAKALELISGCSTSKMNAYIGPHINACCYEVSDELAAQFKCEFGENCVKNLRNLDLEFAIKKTLLDVGFVQERVFSTGICVAEHTDHFFSYRKQGPITGRFGAICCAI